MTMRDCCLDFGWRVPYYHREKPGDFNLIIVGRDKFDSYNIYEFMKVMQADGPNGCSF